MTGQVYNRAEPLAHTYSIVAYDSITGEMGVAVQSHWFSVGTIVSWAEAGVGAIATQSFVNPNFGPDGLAMLKEGMLPQAVLDSLINSDKGEAVRQLAIVDNKGNVAVHTGSKCINAAGHIKGNGYSVQANMMLNDKVWPAMSEAFENAKGSLEERMLTALEAAESVGGDIRGKQSVAMLVVKPVATGKLWEDRKTDLRIADHKEPLVELKRLLRIKEAYDYMNDGDVAMEINDMASALKLYKKAYELYPENEEIKFWTAVTCANAGDLERALPLFKEVFLINENWRELVRRMNGTDLLPLEKAAYDSIMAL